MPDIISPKGMRFRHLTFTGPGLPPICLDLNPGLNIIYGGSNAGKSYILSVLNFMLGGDKPPVLKEGADYDTILLGVEFSHHRSITIHRLRKGGKITVYDDLAEDGFIIGRQGIVLSADHGKGKAGSISEFLLSRTGISDLKVASTQAAKLLPLSLRHLMPYMLIDEDRMFSAVTPTLINPKNSPTLNKNVFKTLLTGKDDSHIATVPDQATLKAGKAGKIELLTELIEELDKKLSDIDIEELERVFEEESTRSETLGEELSDVQEKLDYHVRLRREALDSQSVSDAQSSQLQAMEQRFIDLSSTYATDIRRLEAIEEGGFLLRRFEDQPCPMCGAQPGHQHTPHSPGDFEQQQRSAQAEIRKIERDIENLKPTLQNLQIDLMEAKVLSGIFSDNIRSYEEKIFVLRPIEASIRESYQKCIKARDDAARSIAIYDRRIDLLNRRKELETIQIGRQIADGLTIGIDDNAGNMFAQNVKRVLDAWGYPGVQTVSWDQQSYDFMVNGVARGQNGKGVKAIFHSAFVVAFLVFCRENGLPHPGIVVLDSPLVTYRKPILYKRHGELAPDEAVLAQTTLDMKFYEHLASLSQIGQFLVIENNDPPSAVFKIAKITAFSGQNGTDRSGLFPPLS